MGKLQDIRIIDEFIESMLIRKKYHSLEMMLLIVLSIHKAIF